jgi:HEAT repeat protein
MTEFNEAQAIVSLQQARQLIKKSSSAAAATLIRQLNSPDEKIAQGAAYRLLNKYIPDKQVMLGDGFEEETLPEELAAVADSLREGEDGSQPVDDTPVGGQDSQAPGA